MKKIWHLIYCAIRSEFFRGLWGGLIPALIAMVFVIKGLDQTSKQIRMLNEQISYTREPVMVLIEKIGDYKAPGDFLIKLSLANVGNEVAENVRIEFTLFLFTKSLIYSFGEPSGEIVTMEDTSRSPKEKLWPRLSIKPNEEVDRIQQFILRACLRAYTSATTADQYVKNPDYAKDLYNIRKILNGRYAMLGEIIYRRSSDLSLSIDTTFYVFDPVFGIQGKLEEEIGGGHVIERINEYVRMGPSMSIIIRKDYYEIAMKECWEQVPNLEHIVRVKRDIN